MSPLMTRKLNGRVHEEVVAVEVGRKLREGENFTTMIRECQGNLKEEKRREFNFSVIEG